MKVARYTPLRVFRQLWRLIQINYVLAKNGLEEVIFALHLLRPLRFLLYLLPWHWFRNHSIPRGTRIRQTIEELGPVFIKFGQALSTRRDLLPEDIADELACLQDRVPPFEGAPAIVEKTLNKPLHELFATFDHQPLASASIAQVHAATLPDGREVVVKVVRPDIQPTIRQDIDILYTLADLANRYLPDARRLRPIEVVAEFEKTLIDELDLYREAANASQIRRNFLESPLLYVPEIYWPLVRDNVLVMERIRGIPVSTVNKLKEANVNFKLLAERGVEVFFTQVFVHNFFHADMHPGNIFVSPEHPQDPTYMAVDFGIVGSLAPEDQRYLAENFYAFFRRDYKRVAELHVESGWVPKTTRIPEFESAIRTVSEPIFEKPIKEISFGHFLLKLFQTARRFDMHVQPQLVLLQKTLLNIEGLGRQLYPDLDLWTTAKPFIERWMHEQIGPQGFFKKSKENLPKWIEHLPEFPLMVERLIQRASDGQLELHMQSKQIESLHQEIHAFRRGATLRSTGSALIIGAAIVYGTLGKTLETTWGIPWLSWVLGGMGAIILLRTWFMTR